MKRSFSLLLAFVLAFPLTACGNTIDQPSASTSQPPSQNQEPASSEDEQADGRFDLDTYKTLVSDCRAAISNAGSIVAMIGYYEHYYWEAHENVTEGDIDSKLVVDAAYEWLAENTDETRETVKAAYDSIRQQYNDISLIEPEGTEAEAIDKAFRSMYMAYSCMYALAASPSGCRISFGTMIDDYVNTITKCDEDLAQLLDL